MPARLVTTWYGSFLLGKDGSVEASETFPKDADGIAERLSAVRTGDVLEEERKVAPDGEPFDVLEQRLTTLPGAVRVERTAGGPSPPAASALGYDQGLLRAASLALAASAVREALPSDQPVVLSLRALDLLEKEAARSMELLAHWYGFHFPELGATTDVDEFLELLSEGPHREDVLRRRPDLDPGTEPGRELAPEEAEAIGALAAHASRSRADVAALKAKVEEAMARTAPNLTAVAGPLVGARLVSLAGSLDKLARMPSSTVQLLGAERALFQHIREGAPPPKHGVLFQHPSVHSAPPWLRGRIARSLAGKVSIAARADSSGTHGEGDLGDGLREEFLERVRALRETHPRPPPGWRPSSGARTHRRGRGRSRAASHGGSRGRSRPRRGSGTRDGRKGRGG